jgi:hypothetical protein
MAITGSDYSCGSSGCHGPDPTANSNNVQKASTGSAVLSAIQSVGVMNYWLVVAPGKALVTSVDADDIAAYIVNPASGTATPAASLSPTTLNFGNQVTGTTSATMSATLKNSGTANLVLSTVTLAGTNSVDFTRGGTCAPALTLAPAQTCSIDVTFKPTAIGTRSATVTVAHNASPSTSTLNVTGSGIAAPTPAAGLSATTLAFGNQTVGMTSAARSVTITNTGTATLTLGTITTTGTNPGDFAPSGCSGSSLSAGMGCTISVTFTPAALNARSATLSIPSNAAGSPHGVALTGNGTAAPAPAVTLNPTSLAFGNQTTGTTSPAKTISLTNSGTAGLGINSIVASGTGFAASNTCPATLAAGANCSISVTFAPTTVASYTGSVAISTTAAGSPNSVGLSGSGVAPAPTAPIATFSPAAVDFGTSTLNTSSTMRTVTLTNSGTAALAITAWNLSGTNPGDFAASSACPAGSSIAPGATCAVSVQFTPTDTGTRAATVTLASNAAGSPAIDMKGTGVVQASAMAQVSPTQMTFSRTRVGKTSSARTVRVSNTGTTPLTISSIGTTGDFTASSDCASASLAPGSSCAVKVQFAPTAAGTRTGELTVASNAAGSPHAVQLTGTGAEGGRRGGGRSGGGGVSDDCEEDESACSQSLSPFSFSR